MSPQVKKRAEISEETRAKMRASAQERWRRATGENQPSQSTQSSVSEVSSAPMALPGGASQSQAVDETTFRGMVEKALGRMQASDQTRKEVEGKTKKPKVRNEIPADPEKRKVALASTRILARMPTRVWGELWEALGEKALNEEEKEELVEAWAAVFYYYGVGHPLVGLALAHAGTGSPRVVSLMSKRRRKARGELPAVPTPKPPEPTTNGQAEHHSSAALASH